MNIVLSDVLRCKCSFDVRYGKEEYSKGAKYFFPGVQYLDSDIKRIIALIMLMYIVIKR